MPNSKVEQLFPALNSLTQQVWKIDCQTLYWSVGPILFQGSGLFLRSQLWTINIPDVLNPSTISERHYCNHIIFMLHFCLIIIYALTYTHLMHTSKLKVTAVNTFQSIIHLRHHNSSPHQTSGFLKPRRARYSKDMVVPPPMKKSRGMSCKWQQHNFKMNKRQWKSQNRNCTLLYIYI